MNVPRRFWSDYKLCMAHAWHFMKSRRFYRRKVHTQWLIFAECKSKMPDTEGRDQCRNVLCKYVSLPSLVRDLKDAGWARCRARTRILLYVNLVHCWSMLGFGFWTFFASLRGIQFMSTRQSPCFGLRPPLPNRFEKSTPVEPHIFFISSNQFPYTYTTHRRTKILTRAREGGDIFCPPRMFFVDVRQNNRLVFTIFSEPAQNERLIFRKKSKIDW